MYILRAVNHNSFEKHPLQRRNIHGLHEMFLGSLLTGTAHGRSGAHR